MEKFGKYRGIVTNNNDPLQIGRLMVTVPDVSGPSASWAMPCFPCAGKGFTSSSIPDVGAGVWVEYERGDPSFLVWSGCYLMDGQIIEKRDDASAAPGVKITETSEGMLISFREDAVVKVNDKSGKQILIIDPVRREVRLSAEYKVAAEGQQTEDGEHSVPPVSGEEWLSYLTRLAVTYNTHVHPGGPATPPVPAAILPVSTAKPAPLEKDHSGRKDPVLNETIKNSLQEFLNKAKRHKQVKINAGRQPKEKCLTGLFTGPSGTGKTLAAEVIASQLDLDLYRVDLSSVVSKYIGETEKNLQRIFSKAADKEVVLFFDEADALFGKRTEVKDAHDRYANAEVSYLLQALENCKGIVLFACNKKQNIDPAFIRRMHYVLEFSQSGS